MPRLPEQHSPQLPPGTQVGSWRVEAWQGQGAYGAVYRAVPVSQEPAGPVALKLALYPWDARFAREAELLSRLHHPSIPRLLERGVLRHASGAEYPFFAMEWVEGTPLYLVRLSDRRAVLIDFGSGHFQGASRLTWQSLAPGTPAYLSAQACLFHIRSVRERDSDDR